MKKKLTENFVLVALLTMIMTLLCTGWVFVRIFQANIFADLKATAQMLMQIENLESLRKVSERSALREDDSYRVTVMDTDGNVLYDNVIPAEYLDNQAFQKEVAETFGKGSGTAVRSSDQSEKALYWFACRWKECVLRIGKQGPGIWYVLNQALPYIGGILAIQLGLCLLISRMLTRKFLAPIGEMTDHLDDPNLESYYSELKPFAKRIAEQHEDILRGQKMKEDFTANVTHELKTPLTVVLGYAELLEDDMVPAEKIMQLGSEIAQSAKRLLTMIDDILYLTQYDVMDRSTLKLEDVDLLAVAKEQKEALSFLAENQGVILDIYGSSYLVKGNHQMLDQMVYNLIDNAIRYSNLGGQVNVIIDQGLAVVDHGLGIPEEDFERIFERYFRVDKNESKARGGTGLGLAIVKQIAEIHHATVTVESEIGVGSVFRVKFDETE